MNARHPPHLGILSIFLFIIWACSFDSIKSGGKVIASGICNWLLSSGEHGKLYIEKLTPLGFAFFISLYA